MGEVAGSTAVMRYGDGEGEYRAVRERVGIVERSDLGIVRMWGRDPIRMLNGLMTNDLGQASGTRAVYAAMLTPKGRMITELRALVVAGEAGSEVYFDFPAAAREAVREHLTKFTPPLFARWQFVDDARVLGIYGPRSKEIVERLLSVAAPEVEDGLASGAFHGAAVFVIRSGIAGGDGFDLHVPGAVAAELWNESTRLAGEVGGRTVGMEALETLRIEAGRPRMGLELTDETIPAEAYESTGQMARAISFSKGCYTGQEVVVRIAHRGHVNRNLRGLVLDAGEPLESGAPIVRSSDGKEVGKVTSWTESPLVGRTIALGYLRREVGPGEGVLVGGRSGRVVELPFGNSQF